MKNLIKYVPFLKYLLIMSILFVPSCSFFEADLNGEIFIVTEGRQNIKLALVEISAIPEKDLISFIDKKKSDADKEIEIIRKKSNELHAETESLKKQGGDAYGKKLKESIANSDKEFKYYEGEYYYDGIPKSENICKSNADGKFSLKLKRDTKYAIAAKSSRKIGDSEENYYWLVWVDMKKNPQTVMLSNDNLIDMRSPDCAVKFSAREIDLIEFHKRLKKMKF